MFENSSGSSLFRSPTALKIRRNVAHRADRWLVAVGLAQPRPAPSTTSWVAAETPTAAPAATGSLTREAVQAVLDDMVRPALQSDGGDIQLVDVRGGDVHVKLVGACHSCPSAVLTMKMGVESLLAEELDGFERLIQVDTPPSAEA